MLRNTNFLEIICYDVKTIPQNFVPSGESWGPSIKQVLVADQTDEFIDLNDPGTRLCIVGIKV